MRRFELGGGRRDGAGRVSWLTSAVLHVVLAVLAITVAWQAPFRPRTVERPVVREFVVLPPADGPRAARQPQRIPGGGRVTIARQPLATPPPPDVPLRAPASLEHAGGPVVLGPQLGDGRTWVPPRPALPADVAEALYGDDDTAAANARVTGRLRAMLDSLNRIIDAQQRSRRRPTWATDIAGMPFALDSQSITIAGIKVPTMALAFLGNLLPQGNYDGALRARQFEDMRQDMLQAAQRTETFRDFQRYVKELRARKQAERDAERARHTPPDTTKVIP